MKKLTAGEILTIKLSDYEQFTAVFLESQVAKPLKNLWHLLRAPMKASNNSWCAEYFVLIDIDVKIP